jgi:hypothetical protein
MFVWHYGSEDFGTALVAASDKMLTDEGLGIEYQGSRGKWGCFGKRLLVLVAGDIVIHSEVVKRLFAELKDAETPTTFELAQLAAKEMREYRTQEAERLYLSPLNLDRDSFLDRQRTMEATLVVELANQMQKHKIEAEALVLGCEQNTGSIYRVDRYGLVTNHSDIGFASIGSGGIHSSAHFMFESYSHGTMYYRALYQTFKAKKRAEVAPGVGGYTDMFLVTKNGASVIERKGD